MHLTKPRSLIEQHQADAARVLAGSVPEEQGGCHVTEKKARILLFVAFAVACGSPANAETLSGRVFDPQQRVIEGAQVSVQCPDGTETRTTDGGGLFSFTRQSFAEDCKIRAFHRGFAVLEINIGHKRTWTLQLPLAEVKETVIVRGDRLPQSSLVSASLSSDELRKISDDSEMLIRYAKQLAGVSGGSDYLYVDGMPADHPPQAERIESITVNADPFSAEYSDGSSTHIEILTKPTERKFRLSSGGLSLGPSERDGLNPRLTSTTTTANFGLTGPVPYIPIAFTSDAYFNDQRTEVPIEAVIPRVQGLPITSVDAAPTTSLRGSLGFGADYSRGDTLNVNASLYLWTVKQTNVNVSGMTLPEAGASRFAAVRELRATLRKSGAHFLYRGGLVADWFADNLEANSSNVGINVSGAFIAGGAQINKENSQGNRWTFKNVLEFNTSKHYWSVGATVSRRGDEQSIIPNPAGSIQFDSLQDYVMSATAGAHTGTGLITRGEGKVQFASYTAAPFVEGEIFHGNRLSIRGGLRADYQTAAGGLLFSPRISAVAVLHGFVLRAGSGMFVQGWANNIFLRVMENDGRYLQRFLIANASLSDMKTEGATQEPEIVSQIAPNLTPTRDWLSKFSIEHPFGNFVPGVEYTWTDGTHLLGSQRLSVPTGWQDLLESNRALREQQIHFRAQYKIRGQSLTAHYEWIHARDNTDGPFSFPARQDDIQGEWGPASGIAVQNLTLAGSLQFGKDTSLALIESWHSPTPLNITSGVDAEGNGLYSDRAGRPRNSGRGPSYNSMDLFAHRRFAVPTLFSEARPKMYADFGVQVLNLLGNTNYVNMGTVFGSPLFGGPLAALPGRSVRFSLGFQH